MTLPFFYIPAYNREQQVIILNEDNSRHAVQVLRMQPGEPLRLTDGKGALLTAEILDNHKKKCTVKVLSTLHVPPPQRQISIAISPLKNASRFEWFLEKAAEIGVSGIIPLLCEHTERQHTRQDRLQNILVSALLQSQQSWLPVLHEPTPFDRLIQPGAYPDRLIAHCLTEPRPAQSLADWLRQRTSSATPSAPAGSTPGPTLILIGPEGDFSPKEVGSALQQGFVPVTLGDNRLRTETAGVVAAVLLCIG